MTVLIETITAAFAMEEILYALRRHIVGLNCGRWDYIFSYIKKFRADPTYLIADRSDVGMNRDFMRAYALLCIKTCHHRGALAIGGMAAQIPIKNDEAANQAAFAKVLMDKEREAKDGHDGTWVAHPGLISLAKEVFDRYMPNANQIDRKLDDVQIDGAQLLEAPRGSMTRAGLVNNISVGIRYIEAWLRGHGCSPINHLMEDAATAEISRAQIWQQIHHRAVLDDGVPVTPGLVEEMIGQEFATLRDQGKFSEAIGLFVELCKEKDFSEFLTLSAYAILQEN